MKTRSLLNLGLAVAVIALGLVLYFQPGQHSQARPETRITRLQPGEIHTIRVVDQKAPPIKLVRRDGHWHMRKPLQARADDGRVQRVLGAIDEVADTSYKASRLELAKFGLAKSALKLWLNDTEIDFGGTDPLGGKRYIRVGPRVYVVNDRLHHQLVGPPTAFVSRQLLPEEARITRIVVPHLTVSRDKQGHWHAEPRPANATGDAVQILVDAWQNAYALSVAKAGAATAKPSADSTVATVYLKGRKQPLKFRMVKSANHFQLERLSLGLVYSLPGDLRHDLFALKTKQPAPMEKPAALPKISPNADAGNNSRAPERTD